MPRLTLVSLNVRGLGDTKGFAKLLQLLQRLKKKHEIGVMCIQEHNLNPNRDEDIRTMSKIAGFTAVTTYGRADDPDSQRGGVMTLVTDSLLTVKSTVIAEPGVIILDVEWGAKQLTVGNVYAPAQPLGRIDFFNWLRRNITDDTYIGGDWNCVPDTTLDVDSNNPLGYKNTGISILNDIIVSKKLIDERREQLGNEKEFTRSGANAGGITSSRIDRWYIPIEHDYLITFDTDNQFIFKETSSDHRAVIMKIDDKAGTRGNERDSLDETLTEDPNIQEEIKK